MERQIHATVVAEVQNTIKRILAQLEFYILINNFGLAGVLYKGLDHKEFSVLTFVSLYPNSLEATEQLQLLTGFGSWVTSNCDQHMKNCGINSIVNLIYVFVPSI